MANNLSDGQLMIHTLDLAEINQALLSIQERQDKSRGLRGRAAVFDRLRVDDDTEDEDAVNRRSAASRSQDAVGNILANSDTINLTYDDSVPEIIAEATSLVYLSDGTIALAGPLNHDGATVGFFGATPAAQVAVLTDASTAHNITDPTDSPASADALRDNLVATTIPSIEAALDALGTKINSLIDFAQAHGLMGT